MIPGSYINHQHGLGCGPLIPLVLHSWTRAVLGRGYACTRTGKHTLAKKTNFGLSPTLDINCYKRHFILLQHFCPKRISECGSHSYTAGGDFTVADYYSLSNVTTKKKKQKKFVFDLNNKSN